MNYKRCISTVEKGAKNKVVHKLEIEGKTFISDTYVIYRMDEPFMYPEEKYRESEELAWIIENAKKELEEATLSNIVLDLADSRPKKQARLIYTKGKYGFADDKYLKPLEKAKLKYFLNKDNALVALDAKNNTAAIIAPLRITPEVFEDFETAAYLVGKGGI